MKKKTAIIQNVECEPSAPLLRDVQQTWMDYVKTGLHLTMEEADEWLAQLEDSRDVGPPECHR
ncbi:hypothetical protein [Klebsiella michiganensis]|uniref:hypothetical protein n=1 Tax=Klebsiella michiganensis TaxID=1134687 RepID=UPI003F4F8DF2